MTESNRMLVSIVTPSFNQGRFIEETLSSVKQQDHPNVEHIVVDGASTDRTLETVQQYAGVYNLRWISKPDNGQTDATNKGFRMAEGEIIGWLNSDDVYIGTQTLSKVVDTFTTNPNVDIVYGHALRLNETNEVLRVRHVPSFDYETLQHWCFLIQPAVFFRRHVIERDKLREDLNFSMDYEYWLRLGQKCQWQRINEVLAGDRNHADRKIIAQKHQSANDSARLRAEMDIGDSSFLLKLRLLYLKAMGRMKGLILLSMLYKEDDFAVQLRFRPLREQLKTQLFGNDLELS